METFGPLVQYIQMVDFEFEKKFWLNDGVCIFILLQQ